ncbi:MAG: lipid A deacylase LpxR family protein [Bacteroidetes bacterium]|nr:lipid A deacylase LpxR family protein [Bacteroidota bacterium]
MYEDIYKIKLQKQIANVLLIMLFSLSGIAQNSRSHTIAELTIDNDIVFLIDRYYSSGITMSLYSNWIKKSPINKILLPHGDNEINYYSLNFTHRMYTPEHTLTPSIQLTDHPYATYLLLGGTKISFNPVVRIKRTSKFEFGIIGPMAGGEAIQNGLHKNISYAETSQGWHNQVQNDVCLQYGAIIEKGFLNLPMFEINGFVGATIGVPHTEAQIGSYTRFGFFDDYFRGIGIDISSDLHAWLFCSGSLYLVNYNATLQGGTYNQDNVHTIYSINNTLIHGRFGGVLEYKRISAEYGMEVRSPEFSTAFWHRWAHINIAFVF